MDQYTNFHIVYLSVAIIVSVAVIVYAWRNQQTRGSREFIVACVICIPWMASDIVSRLSLGYTGQWIGEFMRYLCVPWMPVAMYVFVQAYCGKQIGRKRLIKLLAIPTVSMLLILTDPWHHLFFSGYPVGLDGRVSFAHGTYFWFVHIPYCYGMLAAGLFTLLKEYSRASTHYRSQIVLLFFALSTPVAVNVLSLLGLTGKYTPHSFPVFFLAIAFLIFRYQFLGSNPIAYETVFQTIRDGVLILDGRDIIRDINPAAAEGIGKKPSAVIGQHIRDAIQEWPSIVRLYDENPLKLGELEVCVFGTTRYLLAESTPLAKLTGHSEGRIITIRDITERHKHQLSLEEMAFHDPLTRLANRRKFEEDVERAIKAENSFAVFYFDLNRFKEVNDTYGHEVGDELLKYVAARIASTLRKPDILARLGGDEFALLVHDCDEAGADVVTERLLDNVSRPFKVGEIELTANLSIGTAFYPNDGTSLKELLRHADNKMYQAKHSVPNFVAKRIEVSPAIEM